MTTVQRVFGSNASLPCSTWTSALGLDQADLAPPVQLHPGGADRRGTGPSARPRGRRRSPAASCRGPCRRRGSRAAGTSRNAIAGALVGVQAGIGLADPAGSLAEQLLGRWDVVVVDMRAPCVAVSTRRGRTNRDVVGVSAVAPSGPHRLCHRATEPVGGRFGLVPFASLDVLRIVPADVGFRRTIEQTKTLQNAPNLLLSN